MTAEQLLNAIEVCTALWLAELDGVQVSDDTVAWWLCGGGMERRWDTLTLLLQRGWIEWRGGSLVVTKLGAEAALYVPF